MLGAYERSLGWVMRRRRAAMAFSAVIVLATVALFVIVPKGFLPAEDTGQLQGTTEGAEGIAVRDMVAHQREVADILLPGPERRRLHVVRGGWLRGRREPRGVSACTSSRATSAFPSTRSSASCRPRSADVTGLRVFLQNPPAIRIGGRFAQSQYQFTLQSANIDTLYASSRALQARLRRAPAARGRHLGPQIGNPQVNVQIDRERAASLGVSAQQIETALYNAYGSRQVSTIYTQNDEYWVIMELLPRVPEGHRGAQPALRALAERHAGAAELGGSPDARRSAPWR